MFRVAPLSRFSVRILTQNALHIGYSSRVTAPAISHGDELFTAFNVRQGAAYRVTYTISPVLISRSPPGPNDLSAAPTAAPNC